MRKGEIIRIVFYAMEKANVKMGDMLMYIWMDMGGKISFIAET